MNVLGKFGEVINYLDAARADVARLRAAYDEQAARLKAQTERADGNAKESSKLWDENVALCKEVNRLRSELDLVEVDRDDRRAEAERLLADNRRLTLSNAALGGAQDALDSEQGWKRRAERAEKVIRVTRNANQHLSEQLQKLANDNKALAGELKALRKKIAEIINNEAIEKEGT